jgi:DNA uptake protein ComE-like DNA-binding protein
MSLSSEQRALLFLGGVLLMGAGTRMYRAHHAAIPDAASVRALDAQRAAVGNARANKTARKKKKAARDSLGDMRSKGARARKLNIDSVANQSPLSIVDLDTAPESAIAALPFISARLASRIVANRDSLGAFGSLEGLERVSGVGPRTAERIAKLVTFSGTPRPSNSVRDVRPTSPKKRRKL